MRILAACAMMAIWIVSMPVANARTSPQFELSHGAGKLRVPRWNPLAKSARPLDWSDGCGNSSRICATGKSGDLLFYVLGGPLSPQDAKTRLQCEAGATASPSGDQCLVRTGTTTTWTRKFDSMAVSISVDSAKAPAAKDLERWFSEVRWETGK